MKNSVHVARLKDVLRVSPKTVRRLIMAAVVMSSLGLVGWTIRSRYSRVKALDADIEKIPQLSAEITRLNSLWTAEGTAQLESHYAKADALTFKTEEELTALRLRIREQAALFGLKADVSLSERRNLSDQPDLALSTILATCELEPVGPGQPSSTPLYNRLLQFLQSLSTNQAKRVDLVEVAVVGQGAGVARAKINLKLWLTQIKVPTDLKSTDQVSPKRP